MAKKTTKKRAKASKSAASAKKKKKSTGTARARKAGKRGGAASAKKTAKRKVAKSKAGTRAKATARKGAAAPKKTAKKTLKKTVKKTAKKARRVAAKPELSPQERRAAAAAQRKRLRAFGRLLLNRREALLQAYHSTKVDTRDPKMDGTEDYIDYAVSSYDRDFTLSLTEMERRQLLLVEEALTRIKRREYGKCLNCQQVIPEKRLEVEPWARFCIRCQELEEQGLLEERAFDSDFDEEEENGDTEATFDSEDEDSSDDEELSL